MKDNEGKLVDGLLQKDFSIYEDGVQAEIKLFTSDPFPLSAAVIIDQGMSDLTLKKVNQTFSALGGSFGPIRRGGRIHLWQYGEPAVRLRRHARAWRLRCSESRMIAARSPARLGGRSHLGQVL